MRLRFGALVCVLVGCGGGHSTGSGNKQPPASHTLTVQVAGDGKVTSSPAGIDCGAACSVSFAQAVTLTAVPSANAMFAGWSGACSGTGACVVAMTADATVTAAFQAAGTTPHQLRLTMQGSGRVVSSPAGVDCSQSCTAPLVGATTLTAQAAAGWQLKAWSGACSGAADCALPANADADVTATFIQLAAAAVLSISVDGTGLVNSSDGTHCAGKCDVSLPVGTPVSLTATPGSGMSFAGWSGPCSGLQPCSFTLSANTTVGARFISGPPPPQDECDGLMPTSMPDPVVATMPQDGCLGGTSDDGIGNYALGYEAGGGPTFPNYFFFTIQNGQAVREGGTIPGGDESGTTIYSQPSGFTSFHVSGQSGGSSFISWSHDGANQGSQPVANVGLGPSSDYPSSAVGIDPSGGTVAVRTYKDPVRDWVTELARFDKTGQVETPWVTIDTGKQFGLGVGVALSSHAVVLQAVPASGFGHWRARWFARDGSPLTGWFSFMADSYPKLQFLMDGSVLARFVNSGHIALGAGWQWRFQDGKDSAERAPAWLDQRYNGELAVIRNGRGYAMWNAPHGSCGGADAVEILGVASAKSCGCVQLPDPVNNHVAIGRDGSLIVPHQPNGPCQYKLYPQLFK